MRVALGVPVDSADAMVHSHPKKSAIRWTYRQFGSFRGRLHHESPISTLLLALPPPLGRTSGERGAECASRPCRHYGTLAS